MEIVDTIYQDLITFLGECHSVFIYAHPELKSMLVLCHELTSDYDESHDINHHIDVYKNAIKILLKFSFSRDYQNSNDYMELFTIITFSCLLHDTIDHKYKNNIETKKEKLENYLKNTIPSMYHDIMWVIDNISYSKEVKNGYPKQSVKRLQLARDIVSDADKLEAIGPIGIERCRQFNMANNPNASENEITKLIVEHCHDKLLKIRDFFIQTLVAKNMAKERHEFIVEFVKSNSNN